MPQARFDEVLKAIDNLATSTAKGFAEVHEEIADIRSDLKTDIAKLDSKIDNLQNRLDAHAGLDRKVERLENDIVEIKERVGMAA